MQNPEFQSSFNEGIRVIKAKTGLQISQIIWELSKTLNRNPSAIRYWQKGYPPPNLEELEKLASEMIQLSSGALNSEWLLAFLRAAKHPSPLDFCSKIFSASLYSKAISMPTRLFHKFIGRQSDVEKILDVLMQDNLPVITISGLGGIGKTSLIRHIFEIQLKAERFDYYIWVDDNNDRDLISYERILNQIAVELGLERFGTLSEREKNFYLQLRLGGKKLLLVIDDLENASENQDEILRKLFPVLRGSKIFAASRVRFRADGLNGYDLSLSGLTFTETSTLIAQESIIKDIKQAQHLSDNELEQIYDVTGGSPEAIRLILGQMRRLPTASILNHLRNIIPIEKADQDQYLRFYREIYMQSWNLIADSSKRALIILAQFPIGSGGNWDALAQITGFDSDELERSLNELWQYSLVENALEIKKYFLHHLTRNFVTSEFSKQ